MLLSTAKHRIGLLKQLFLPALDLILVYIKLLGKLRQRLVAFNRCQRHLGLNPGKWFRLLRFIAISCRYLKYLRNIT